MKGHSIRAYLDTTQKTLYPNGDEVKKAGE